MGQYYNAVINVNGNKEVFYHQVDGKYMMAKLMEHGYWANPFVLAVASKLWRTKGQLAWVGDYAENGDFNWHDDFADAHNSDVVKNDLEYNGFRLEGKYFINHSKKLIIDCDRYKSLLEEKKIDMIVSPVPLLTAVGNDKDGGDFRRGVGKDLVGTWAWDIVEITDQPVYDWEYNGSDWDKKLKTEFADYEEVTDEYLFIED